MVGFRVGSRGCFFDATAVEVHGAVQYAKANYDPEFALVDFLHFLVHACARLIEQITSQHVVGLVVGLTSHLFLSEFHHHERAHEVFLLRSLSSCVFLCLFK